MARRSLSKEIEDIRGKLGNHSIVLVGLMGAGKSSIGRRLAESRGKRQRQREQRKREHGEMDTDGGAHIEQSGYAMRIGITRKQHGLEEHHRD